MSLNPATYAPPLPWPSEARARAESRMSADHYFDSSFDRTSVNGESVVLRGEDLVL